MVKFWKQSKAKEVLDKGAVVAFMPEVICASASGSRIF